MQFVFVISCISLLLGFTASRLSSQMCDNADWWDTLDRTTWSVCPKTNTYLRGFWRSAFELGDERVGRLEVGRCCDAVLPQYSSQPATCSDADLSDKLNRYNIWALCPSGYFMNGLRLGYVPPAFLNNIDEAKCCHPQNHPSSYGECYDEDVTISFDRKGWSECQRDGFYMIGFYKSSCDKLYCIEKFRCCKMKNDTTDAGWNKWEDWGECSAPCEDGEQERVRNCSGTNSSRTEVQCIGPNKETRPCNNGPCKEKVVGCDIADWEASLDRIGWSVCPRDTTFLKGLWRHDPMPSDNRVGRIEYGKCCAAEEPAFINQSSTCLNADWSRVLTRFYVWALCPNGSFMNGLSVGKPLPAFLNDIDKATCCYPQNHPSSYEECYDEDVSISFDTRGWSECQRDGFYMTGFYKSSCDNLYCIEKFRCCKMKNENHCLEECTSGRHCREFGKYLCLCSKGKKGRNCRENDTVAIDVMISLKINNKKWSEELTDLSDLDTKVFLSIIIDSVEQEFKGSGVGEINVTRLREGSVIADVSLTFDQPVGESEVESLLQDVIKDGSLGTLEVDTFAVGPTLPDLVTVPGPVPSEPTKVINDVIYGSVIGVLALILAVIAIFMAWKRRKREEDDRLNLGTKRSRTLQINEGFGLESSNGKLSTVAHHGLGNDMELNEVRSLNGPATEATWGYLEINEYAPLHLGTRSWEVERENVTIEKVIGKGAFGQVAQGKASNLRGREETITVAIKMLKGNARDLEREDLLSELEIMKKLKPHPHVIKLLGCVTKSDPLLVLIEYVPYGDLLGYLRKSRHLDDNYFKDPDIKPPTSLTSLQLMKFSWQVADGMHYLSSKNIIHRDLAARNVLVGERERCKVTDFGMARDVCQENIYERKSKGRLPVKWTASEALLYGRYTTKSDVWSFGIVLYEIFTIGGSPYPKIDGREIAHLLSQGYRMPKPRHLDDTLYKIMQDCWQENPDDRPVFESLRNDLKEMENQHQRLINMQLYDNILYANVE